MAGLKENALRISIVTVCFNSQETIRDAIESVLNQTYGDIEYIIVDGGSSDSTMDIVYEYRSKISKIISESDEGIYDAMNKGVSVASGEFVGILNSDDFYEDLTVIESVAQKIEMSPGADLVFGDVVFVQPDNIDHVVRYYNANNFRPWKLRFGWMPPHPATFIRKAAYLKVGLYSVDYKISADYEFFVRMLLVEKLPLVRLDRTLVRMRAGGVSTAGVKSSIVLNKEIVRACRNNGIYTNLLFVLSKIPFKLLELIR